MAERRMFTKKVTDDDNFINLPATAQALYLHLAMGADDDGFSNKITVAMFKAHATAEDLQALIDNKFIYNFENGVIVIKHWLMANAIRKDRYNPTTFQEQFKTLKIKQTGAYTLSDDGCQMVAKRLPNGCQTVAKWLPQVRLGKDSIDKDSIVKDSVDKDSNNNNIHSSNNIDTNVGDKRKGAKAPARAKFQIPTLEEVKAYCFERGNQVDPEKFINYYTSNGWYVGRNKMKDWKAAVRSWEGNGYRSTPAPRTKAEELDDFYKMTAEWAASDDNA